MDRNKTLNAALTRQTEAKAKNRTIEESSDDEGEENASLSTNNIPGSKSNNHTLEADNISRSSSNSPDVGLDVGLGLAKSEPLGLQNHENNGSFAGVENSLEATLHMEEPEVAPRSLPAVNVPEKIVLCIDTSEDPDYVPFKLRNETMYPPLYMIKRIVEIFIYSKNKIDKRHEFALVVLQDNKVNWVRNFTSDRRVLLKELEKLSPSAQGPSFDLTELFEVIIDNTSLPESVPDPAVNTPSFVPRVILLYSRSHCVPSFMRGKDAFDFISKCPYFTLDFLYIHEEPSEDNKCVEIYSQLSELDVHGYCYSFNVTRNTTKLHDIMAKLLAHPLQRPRQKEVTYKFDVHNL